MHGNHLGVPLVVTDASGNPATTPDDYLVPGFPGQSRVLADLYYNRYRDYDPTTGRYIQADPIGLQGGQNNYAYAGNNPINRIDPSGQIPFLVIPGICAAGGCELLGTLGLGALWYGTHPVKLPPKASAPGCPPNDDGSDSCVAGWIDEVDNYCAKTFKRKAYRRCVSRANDRLRACKREGGVGRRMAPIAGPIKMNIGLGHDSAE